VIISTTISKINNFIFFTKKPTFLIFSENSHQWFLGRNGKFSLFVIFKSVYASKVIFSFCAQIFEISETIGRKIFFYTRVVVKFSRMLRGSNNHYMLYFLLYILSSYIVSCFIILFIVIYLSVYYIMYLLLYTLLYILYIILFILFLFSESFCNI
jgi:hypothetical protein